MSFGLSLSGGGVKGAAHIGVLKVLEEENIKIDNIAGTSSGSIVAALYATGFSVDEIYKIFKQYGNKIKYVDFKNITRLIYGLVFKRKIIIDGFNSGIEIEKLINNVCKEKGVFNISNIKMSLIIPSVDMCSGNVLCFCSRNYNSKNLKNTIFINNINIGKAVRASCSYPVIFSPCDFENMKLIDGGIRENMPWRELKEIGTDKVLSVIFKDTFSKVSCKNIIDVASRSINLLSNELTSHELNGTDYVLEIDSKKIGLLDMDKIDELYNLGYNVAKKNIRLLRNLGK